MRVLYVIDSLAPGGAETSLMEMAPLLVSGGVDLHVLPLGTAMDLAPALEAAEVQVHRRTSGRGRLANIRAITQLVRAIRPDLVHTTLYEADIAGRTAARLAGVPASTSLVNEYYGSSHAREVRSAKLAAAQAVDRVTASLATRFHAVSAAVAESVAPRLGIRPERIEVISRGRDPRRFCFRPEELRRRTRDSLGLAPDVPVVLGVGRLEPQKGFQHLLAAAPALVDRIPEAAILIAGRDGRSGRDIRAAAALLGPAVRFLGHRTDMPALLAAADVLAFPSEREGSPGTLIEAMAVGTPIVASDIRPNLEVLGGQETALITPTGDPASLAAALIQALEARDGASVRADAARLRFEDHYTIGAVAGSMVRFFAGAAGARTARSRNPRNGRN